MEGDEGGDFGVAVGVVAEDGGAGGDVEVDAASFAVVKGGDDGEEGSCGAVGAVPGAAVAGGGGEGCGGDCGAGFGGCGVGVGKCLVARNE